MIYLIGGSSKCGKTTLAKILSAKLSVPWISADTLQNIAWAYLPQEEHRKYFPHRYLKGEDNDKTYSQNSAEQIVAGYIAQGKTSYRAISMMAETMIADEDDYIVEGYQVTPEVVGDIVKKFGQKNIRAVFLIKLDEAKFIEDIHKSTTPNDWIIRKTKQGSTYAKIARMISSYSSYFEEESKKYNLKLLYMDYNFENNIDEAVRYLSR